MIADMQDSKNQSQEKPHFKESKYWIDFYNLLCQNIHNMDIIEAVYQKLVTDSKPFDVNELWKPFIYNEERTKKSKEYISSSVKYILNLGGSVNYLVSSHNPFKIPVWALIVWNLDKPMIKLVLTEYDCDLTIKRVGEQTFLDYYIKERDIEEFVESLLEQRKMILKMKELNSEIEELKSKKTKEKELSDELILTRVIADSLKKENKELENKALEYSRIAAQMKNENNYMKQTMTEIQADSKKWFLESTNLKEENKKLEKSILEYSKKLDQSVNLNTNLEDRLKKQDEILKIIQNIGTIKIVGH